MSRPTKATFVDTAVGHQLMIPPDTQAVLLLASWASRFETPEAVAQEIAGIRAQERDLDDKVRALMERAARLQPRG